MKKTIKRKINQISIKKKFKNYGDFTKHNLENVDLSFLKIKQETAYWIDDANLKNTGLHITLLPSSTISNTNLSSCNLFLETKYKWSTPLTFNNVIFDKKQIEFLNSIYKENIFKYDAKTVLNNDNLYVTSKDLLNIIHEYLRHKERNYITSRKYLKEQLEIIEKLINKDIDGHLKKLYEFLTKDVHPFEILNIFKDLKVYSQNLSNFIFDEETYKLFQEFDIDYCSLENITFDTTTKTLFDTKGYHIYNNLTNIKMPNLAMNYTESIGKRISRTPFTFQKNLYLELSRDCNGNCKFCRNHFFENKPYNLNQIINTINENRISFSNINIGGGEPTLRQADLEKLIASTKLYNQANNVSIVSNGSGDYAFYRYLYYEYGIKTNISRHSFDDNINANILGIDNSKILNSEMLEEIPSLSLSCTCIKGGIDSLDKIVDYINYAFNMWINNLLFCNLQDTASVENTTNLDRSLSIDENIFIETIEFLKHQNYTFKYPIISTGGYKLYILKKGSQTISFKQYISKEDLLNLWPAAIKRTYDFSLSPDGNLYSDWSETTENDYSKKLINK